MKEELGLRWIKLFSVAVLLTGCENQIQEIEQLTEVTVRGSVGTNDLQANGDCMNPSISSDGRFIAFESMATNLVPVGTNGKRQILVRDRLADTVELVSLHNSSGQSASDDCWDPAISGDGQFVAFQSRSNLYGNTVTTKYKIYVRAKASRTTVLASHNTSSPTGEPNDDCTQPSISADGRFVVFTSKATNLVASYSGTKYQVYVVDMSASPSPSVTLVSHTTSSLTTGGNGDALDPAISADGKFIAFSSDSNFSGGALSTYRQIYLAGNPALPGAAAPTKISLAGGVTEANFDCVLPAISQTGDFVAFLTQAPNLTGFASGNAQSVIRWKKSTGAHDVVSVDSSGIALGQGNESIDCTAVTISGDGQSVGFLMKFGVGSPASPAHVPFDTGALGQIFLRHMDAAGGVVRVSIDSFGTAGNANCGELALSGDRRFIAFESRASNLVVNDTNGAADVFLRFPLR